MVVTGPVIPYGPLLNAVKSLPRTSVEDRVVAVAACFFLSVRKGEAK